MQLSPEPARALASRLRALRERHWPGVTLTQTQLADALSLDQPVSVPAISSWESFRQPKIPPPGRLDAYARFFCTRRSIVADGVSRLLSDADLTEDELEVRDQLRQELLALRTAAIQAPTAAHRVGERPVPSARPDGGGTLHFADGAPVTIVLGQLPPDMLEKMRPFTDRDDPDYIEAYEYADLGALLELHGHLRAVNPDTQVNVRTVSKLMADDYTTHLVVLGGVDWNLITSALLEQIELPVQQAPRKRDDEIPRFIVVRGPRRQDFAPKLVPHAAGKTLVADVAHFFRAPNPFNKKRTVTIFNGMYGRGTLGAVRALTDARFRDRNETYLASRFGHSDTFSILMRVPIVRRDVVTPDWTDDAKRLDEWPEAE